MLIGIPTQNIFSTNMNEMLCP